MKRFTGRTLGCGLLLAWVPILSAQVPAPAPVPRQTVAIVDVPRNWDAVPGAATNPFSIQMGSGVYLLQPEFSSNPGFTITGNGTATQQDIRHDTNLAPLTWITVLGPNGWGGQARWFEYDQSSITDTLVHPGGGTVVSFPQIPGLPPVATTAPGQRLSLGSGLDLDSLDFDLIKQVNFGPRWQALLGVGVSYRNVEQNFQGYVGEVEEPPQQPQPPAAPVPPPPSDFYLFSRSHFTGIGPTFSLALTHQLGNSPFYLYGNNRYTLLARTIEQTTFFQEEVDEQVVNQVSAFQCDRGITHVGEVELGLRMVRPVGSYVLFLQSGFVFQVWGDIGNATNAGGEDLFLFGGAFSGGVQF